MPNNKKLSRFVKKPMVDELIANNTVNAAGLQGKMINPKNAPNNTEFKYGFFASGVFIFGKISEKLKLKIIIILTTVSIPKAIGETIPITFVNDS